MNKNPDNKSKKNDAVYKQQFRTGSECQRKQCDVIRPKCFDSRSDAGGISTRRGRGVRLAREEWWAVEAEREGRVDDDN